jgi:hypothetical protein
VNCGTSYVNGSYLFDGDESFNTFVSSVKATLNDPATVTPLIPSTDSTVAEGYKAIYQSYADKILPKAGLIEILFSINTPGTITVQTALQTPLSQGRLSINSSSIFDPPVVNPWYFSHPAGTLVCSSRFDTSKPLLTFSNLFAQMPSFSAKP